MHILLIIFVALAAVTLVLAIPGVAMILLFATLGLSLPLLLLPTVLLYYTLALPGLLVACQPGRRWTGLALAAALPVLVGVGVPLLARHQAERDAATWMKDDKIVEVEASALLTPPVVELLERRDLRPFQLKHPLSTFACSALCQTLLGEGLASRVRVGIENVTDGQRAEQSVTYRIESRTDCPEAFAKGTPRLPVVANVVASGRCFVADGEDTTRPDWRFANRTLHPTARKKTPQREGFLTGKSGVRQIVVHQISGDRRRLVWRRTAVEGRPLFLPLSAQIHMSMNSSSGGLAWIRSEQRLRPFVFEKEVVGWLERLKAGKPPAVEPDEPQLRRHETPADHLAKRHKPDNLALLKQLLARSGSEPFGPEVTQALREWSLSIRRRNLTAEETELVRGVLADPRFTDLSLMAIMLREQPQVTATLLPLMLDRLAVKTPERTGHGHSALGYAIAALDPALLKPHAPRIVAIVEAEDNWHMAGLLTVVGQLGLDTSDLIRARLGAASSATVKAAAVAVCRAEPEVAGKLFTDMRARLQHYSTARGKGDHIRSYYLALVRHGLKDEAAQVLGLPDRDLRGLLMRTDLALEAGFSSRRCVT